LQLFAIIKEGGGIMNKFKIASKIGMATAMTLALMPALVLAQLPTPTSPYAGAPITLTDVQGLIETIARFMILVSVIIAVIFIVWGGISYMSAGDDSSRISAARSRIINGIIGALVVLAVGLILQTLASLVNWTAFFNV
jgi:hypothetical protein